MHTRIMHWTLVLLIAFGLIALAEFGDKTQLMTVTLASKYKMVPVFWGVFLGMSAITLLGVIVGTALFSFVPPVVVKVIAGVLFIFFGIYTFISEEDDETIITEDRHIFRDSFILSAVSEFGDKTQFAVIALTAHYAAPLPVFVGAICGLALVVGIGTLLGRELSQFISAEKIKLGAAVLFVIIGAIFLVEALL